MELSKKNSIYIHLRNLVFFFFTTSILLNCCKDDAASQSGDEVANIALSVIASSINKDKNLWEDRVDELRMIVFDSGSGEMTFNQMLYFPNGFFQNSKAVRLRPGTYDFYFIANENVYAGDFVSSLRDIKNKTEFSTNPRFSNIKYNPGFIPDGTTDNGRFLMSAIYDNITIVSGGTENAPLSLPLPTSKVELIRALAKVEIIFKKKISGTTIPESTITSVRLDNVASNLSVPPYDNYYVGSKESSELASLSNLNYAKDTIGSVIFYIPEFLRPEEATDYTEININNKAFPVLSDGNQIGIMLQRRNVPSLSDRSVIRNYHYIINALVSSSGGIEIKIYTQPWKKDKYEYFFQGDKEIVLPPVIPTDSSIIIPTDCGKIELLNHNENLATGLQGAYNDVVNYWDPQVGGPVINRGEPPFYCEKKYGPGWRLMNSCELLSFLAFLDQLYTVWMSNTWLANTYNIRHPDKPIPFYPLLFRERAQVFLEEFTGTDLSGTVLMEENNWEDQISDTKLNIIDQFFTPGDIVVKADDFPGGWPYPGAPGTSPGESWYYNEVSIQVKAFWYNSGYISLADRSNWYIVLYGNKFKRYDFSGTVCRCVRDVE